MHSKDLEAFAAIPDFLIRAAGETPTRRRRLRAKKTAWKVRTATKRLPKAWRGAKTAFVMAYPPVFPTHFPTGYRQVLYLSGKGTVRVREVVWGERRAATAKLTAREFERSLVMPKIVS